MIEPLSDDEMIARIESFEPLPDADDDDRPGFRTPTLPGDPRIRLPPASPCRYDGRAMDGLSPPSGPAELRGALDQHVDIDEQVLGWQHGDRPLRDKGIWSTTCLPQRPSHDQPDTPASTHITRLRPLIRSPGRRVGSPVSVNHSPDEDTPAEPAGMTARFGAGGPPQNALFCAAQRAITKGPRLRRTIGRLRGRCLGLAGYGLWPVGGGWRLGLPTELPGRASSPSS